MAEEEEVSSEGGVKGATSVVTGEREFLPFFRRAVRAATPRQPGRSAAGRRTLRPAPPPHQRRGGLRAQVGQV